DSFDARRQLYGTNTLPERNRKTLFSFMYAAMEDPILILLSVVALISLALGLYTTFGTPAEYTEDGVKIAKVDWVEGVAIMIAVLIVVLVTSINDFQRERQFVKLNRKKEDRIVNVVRNGAACQIGIAELLVGDIMLIEPGDLITADGVIISGQNLRFDESSATGESNAVKKVTADHAIAVYRETTKLGSYSHSLAKIDPFILSGSKCIQGTGQFLVTAVGVNSLHGQTMMSLHEGTDPTPLQNKLVRIAETIAKFGSGAAILLFVVTFIRFLANLPDDHRPAYQKGMNFIDIVITAITLVVVAVPEGLPLAVTLALAFATVRMLKDNNLVRQLKACETMGNASAVCSDKTGTLTQNRMTVTAGLIGSKFCVGKSWTTDDAVPLTEFAGKLNKSVFDLLFVSIVSNCSAFEEEGTDSGFVGSKTETALLCLARDHMGMSSLSGERSKLDIVQILPFDSVLKYMAVVVKVAPNSYRLFVKGASEIVLDMCKDILSDPANSPDTAPLSDADYALVREKINEYSSNSLRTICIGYKDIESTSWPPLGFPLSSDDSSNGNLVSYLASKPCTLIGLVGIEDPLRPGVAESVAACKRAGVTVRMVTGDFVMTARAIAKDCGIYDPVKDTDSRYAIMEGPVFRALPQEELQEAVKELRVLARSSPADKRKLVKTLKEQHNIVAVTGDGTNDAPALKLADVGFSMGIAGTDVAKEASDIILMDDNFSSIVKALLWGRAVNDAVKKFLQFQLTVNITAVLLTFVTAVASSDGKSVLTAVQLLWVNLIMDTFAALALATDPPSESMLDRQPELRNQSLISVNMWKMIIGQAIYQVTVTLIFHFISYDVWDADTGRERATLDAMVFNIFVWMQIFNMINSRRLDNKLNIFENITKNRYFWAILLVIIGGQCLIMFVGGAAFSVHRQTGAEWVAAIICGVISIPIGALIRLFPNRWIPTAIIGYIVHGIIRSNSEIYSSAEFYNPLESVREQLLIQKIRGGRLRGLSFKEKSRVFYSRMRSMSSFSGSRSSVSSRDGSYSPNERTATKLFQEGEMLSSITASLVLPGIVAGSVAGWS
ncbi:hypothetical protein CANCADRAFT_13458, partial [Tortispora caseinolytica NRRL Y-17796]